MLRLRSVGFVLLLLLVSSAAASAAAEQAPPPAPLQVVTPGRAPQPIGFAAESVTVITAKEITDSGIRSLADVLRLVPGVFVQQGGEFGFPSFARVRGTDLSHLLVLVNGERVSTQGFALGTDLSRFTVEEITRIEVVRGALSCLYGSDAIGGVVNIITDQDSTTAGGKAELGYGSQGRQTRSLIATGGGKLGVRVGAISPVYDGRREGAGYSATRYFADLLPSLGNWKVAVRAHHYQDTSELARWVMIQPQTGGPTMWVLDTDDRQTTQRTRYSVSASRVAGAGGLGVQAYRLEEEYRPVFSTFMGTTDMRITADTDASDFNYTYATGGHNLVIGGEARREKYEATDLEASTTRRKSISNRGIYLDDHWLVDNSTLVVAGVRYDDHSVAGRVTSPRIALIRALPGGLQARASYAEGFRSPGFVELYAEEIGNPDLRAEKSRQYELALTATRGNDTLEAVAFNYDVTDQIALTTAFPGQYGNINRARQRGVEASWQRRIAPAWLLTSSLTFVDATDRATDEQLPGVPRHLGSLSAQYDAGAWKAVLAGWWNADIPAFAGVRTPDRAVFDLSAVWRLNELLQPYLTIRNLANTAVLQRGTEDEPLGVSFEFGIRSAW